MRSFRLDFALIKKVLKGFEKSVARADHMQGPTLLHHLVKAFMLLTLLIGVCDFVAGIQLQK
jgi:hypothetical protein